MTKEHNTLYEQISLLRCLIDDARTDFALKTRPSSESHSIFGWSLCLYKIESILNIIRASQNLSYSELFDIQRNYLSSLNTFEDTRKDTSNTISRIKIRKGKVSGIPFATYWIDFQNDMINIFGNLKILIDSIDSKNQFADKLDLERRLRALETFARNSDGIGVAKRARELFSGRVADTFENGGDVSTIPNSAPERWLDRKDKSEKPPEFIERVYGDWLGKGLNRAHIRNLDPSLSTALDNWLRKPKNALPPHIDLPTLKEHNSRLLRQQESSDSAPLNITEAEGRRLYHVGRRRAERAKQT